MAIGLAVCGIAGTIPIPDDQVPLKTGQQQLGLLGLAAFLAICALATTYLSHRANSVNAASLAGSNLTNTSAFEPAPAEFLYELGKTDDFSYDAAFKGADRIDILLRAGTNILGEHGHLLAKRASEGCKIRILLLDPASEAARVVYGPNRRAYLANAKQISVHLDKLFDGAKSGNVSIRLTRALPPFSMYIATWPLESQSCLVVRLNFTYTLTGSDRPAFSVKPISRWYPLFQSEFDEIWRNGKKATVEQIAHRVDSLETRIHNLDSVEYAFRNTTTQCPFDGQDAASSVYYENDLTRILYDISPIVEGHSLVIPRRHVMRLSQLTTAEFVDLTDTARQLSERIINTLGATGVVWALQDGVSAGQTVPHVHLHVIPRTAGDLGDNPGKWMGQMPDTKGLGRAIDSRRRRNLDSSEMSARVQKYREIMTEPFQPPEH